MEVVKLNVSGMMCSGCENRVKNAIYTLDGVKNVEADHENGSVIVKSDIKIDIEKIKSIITDLGFDVK